MTSPTYQNDLGIVLTIAMLTAGNNNHQGAQHTSRKFSKNNLKHPVVNNYNKHQRNNNLSMRKHRHIMQPRPGF